MTPLREAAQQALEALTVYDGTNGESKRKRVIAVLRAALAEPEQEPVQEPVAWSHNLIDNIITHRPADIDRHPDRWTALYPEPRPCPTCEALARTVMMDQTGYDPAPPQRKPLTDEEIEKILIESAGMTVQFSAVDLRFARAIEHAHGIKENP